MTTTVLTDPTRRTSHAARPGFGDLLRSEWIKFTSLRMNVLGLVGLVLVGFGGALALALTLESSGVPSTPSVARTVYDLVMPATLLGAVVAGILGVMVVGPEYSSGTMQATLLATPARGRVLAAKSVLAFGVVAIAGLITVVAAWAVTYPMYAEFGLEAPLGAPGVALALVGAAVYLGCCALVGLGVTTLFRSTTAGAIVMLCITLLLPPVFSLLPNATLTQVLWIGLLSTGGGAMSSVATAGAPFIDLAAGGLAPGAGWLVVVAWTVVALTAGAIALHRRDA